MLRTISDAVKKFSFSFRNCQKFWKFFTAVPLAPWKCPFWRFASKSLGKAELEIRISNWVLLCKRKFCRRNKPWWKNNLYKSQANKSATAKSAGILELHVMVMTSKMKTFCRFLFRGDIRNVLTRAWISGGQFRPKLTNFSAPKAPKNLGKGLKYPFLTPKILGD